MSEFARFRPCSPLISALLATALLVTAACGSAPSASATSTASHEQATATPGNAQPTPAQLAADWRAGDFKVDPITVMYWEDPVSGKKYNGILLGPPLPKTYMGKVGSNEPVQLPIIGVFELTAGDYVLLADMPGGHTEAVDIGSDNLRYSNALGTPAVGRLIPLAWGINSNPDGYYGPFGGASPSVRLIHRESFISDLQQWFVSHPGRAADVIVFLHLFPLDTGGPAAALTQAINASYGTTVQFYEHLSGEGVSPASLDNGSEAIAASNIPFHSV